MPVKEADLKNFETYRKAIKADLPKIAAGNCKFFLYKDVELPNEKGKKQKYPAFLIVADDSGARKGLSGKKAFCKGLCSIKEERIAFEPESGDVPYKKLKISIPLIFGKQVFIPAGMEEQEGGEGAEETGAEAAPVAEKQPEVQAATPPPEAPAAAPEPPAAAPPAPPRRSPELAGAWQKLLKAALAHAAAHPELKDALKKAATGIPELINANQAAEAQQRMDQLQALMAGAGTKGAGPKAGAAPLSAEARKSAARWNVLVKRMQAVVAKNPDRKADFVRASAGIPDMIKVGKFELANQLMNTVATLLVPLPPEKELRARYALLKPRIAQALKDPAYNPKRLKAMVAAIAADAKARDFEGALKAVKDLERVLEPEAVNAMPKTAEPAEESDVSPKVAFERRFAALDAEARKVLGANQGDTSQIRSVLSFAWEKGNDGGFTAAMKALDRLQMLIQDAGPIVEKPRPQVPPMNVVKYRQALREFIDQIAIAAAQRIENLQRAIPAQLPRETDLAKALAVELTSRTDSLAEAINAAIATARNVKAPVDPAFRKSLNDYITQIGSDELIRWVDQNPFSTTAIGPLLQNALAKIKQMMPAPAPAA